LVTPADFGQYLLFGPYKLNSFKSANGKELQVDKGDCYESPKKEIISCAFKHLIHNIKLYNKDKI